MYETHPKMTYLSLIEMLLKTHEPICGVNPQSETMHTTNAYSIVEDYVVSVHLVRYHYGKSKLDSFHLLFNPLQQHFVGEPIRALPCN